MAMHWYIACTSACKSYTSYRMNTVHNLLLRHAMLCCMCLVTGSCSIYRWCVFIRFMARGLAALVFMRVHHCRNHLHSCRFIRQKVQEGAISPEQIAAKHMRCPAWASTGCVNVSPCLHSSLSWPMLAVILPCVTIAVKLVD